VLTICAVIRAAYLRPVCAVSLCSVSCGCQFAQCIDDGRACFFWLRRLCENDLYGKLQGSNAQIAVPYRA
jgi:hypothetical protein